MSMATVWGALGGEAASLEVGAVVQLARDGADFLGDGGADAAIAAGAAGDGDRCAVCYGNARAAGDIRKGYTFHFRFRGGHCVSHPSCASDDA